MERSADIKIDLRGTPCPLNWVKTKLRLEEMAPGQVIEVFLDQGAPERNVPRSAAGEGHQVLESMPERDGVRVFIKKCG